MFDILKIISGDSKFSEYLINNIEFVKLVARQLHVTGDRETIDNEDIFKLLQILQNILFNDCLETHNFLIKDGIALFFLNAMLEKSQTKKIRIELAKLLIYKLDEVESTIGAFIPI